MTPGRGGIGATAEAARVLLELGEANLRALLAYGGPSDPRVGLCAAWVRAQRDHLAELEQA